MENYPNRASTNLEILEKQKMKRKCVIESLKMTSIQLTHPPTPHPQIIY